MVNKVSCSLLGIRILHHNAFRFAVVEDRERAQFDVFGPAQHHEPASCQLQQHVEGKLPLPIGRKESCDGGRKSDGVDAPGHGHGDLKVRGSSCGLDVADIDQTDRSGAAIIGHAELLVDFCPVDTINLCIGVNPQWLFSGAMACT